MASTTPIKKSASGNKALDPLDLYDLRSELSDEERMVQDSVSRFVNAKVLPVIRDAFEKHYFPKELIPQVAELGLLGSSIEGYDCAGLNSVCYG
ncbi:MAG: acyl-CoA dehydrogenase family protein, partial [Woeseiaceae bacterium]